jgi:hypothetical protein
MIYMYLQFDLCAYVPHSLRFRLFSRMLLFTFTALHGTERLQEWSMLSLWWALLQRTAKDLGGYWGPRKSLCDHVQGRRHRHYCKTIPETERRNTMSDWCSPCLCRWELWGEWAPGPCPDKLQSNNWKVEGKAGFISMLTIPVRWPHQSTL